MENEGQQRPPLPPGGPAQQQPYYGWQYEQDQPAQSYQGWQYEPGPAEPVVPSQPLSSSAGTPAASPGPLPPTQFRPLRTYGSSVPSGSLAAVPQPFEQASPSSPSYQEPLPDMGSSLGYGQGMEYQYFNAPQPSQALPMMRQARLRQLRSLRSARTYHQQGDALIPADSQGPSGERGAGKLASLFSLPWRVPDKAVEPGPAENTAVTSLPSAPMAPSRPAGLLSLPSKPLPAVPQQSPVLTQDTGARQKAVMARATLILTGSFIIGRVLGLARTSLFAYVFGTSWTSDAYLQAFLIPDLIFNVIAGGALSSAFIPVFTHYMLGKKDEKTAWHIASSALNLALAIMCVLALFAILLAPRLVPLYTPGVSAAEINLIITLTRIMLLQAIIMGGGVIINSVLYARQQFLLPAIGTVLYNVGLIIGLLPGFFLTFFGRSDTFTAIAVYAATIGVILGALLQVGIQLPGVLKEKMHYTFVFDWRHPGVLQIGRQMLPRVLNAMMLYFSTFVDRALILILVVGPLVTQEQGMITQYYQALQLMLLPLGIFGMAVSTAAFPTLAENVTLGRLDRVRAIIEETLRSMLFLSIPASVGLIVLGLPIIQVLLQHGAFTLDDAAATAVPLAGFALGLTGLTSVEILTRSFYAFRDSRTPVIVSIAQFVLKILLSLLLLHIINWGPAWGLGSLAFATSVAGSLEAAVLLYLLQRKIGMLGLRRLARFTGRVLLASLAMGALLLMLRFLLDVVLMTTVSQHLGVLGTIFALFKLAAELAVGLLIYIWATRQFGIEDFWKQGPVRRVLQRLRLSWV